MYPRPFEYFAPRTVGQALALLRRYRGDAKILAGGMSLIPLMKLRLASPKYIIDLNRIKGLAYIKEKRGYLLIGALTRHSEIEYSELIQKRLPVLSEVASQIADPQVRNRGTIGGSLAHADPAGDWGPISLAHGAEMVVLSQAGKRRVIKAEKLFVGPFETAVKPTEILSEIRFPIPRGQSGSAYLKFARKAGDFATVSVAVSLTLGKGGVVKSVGIGLGAVGPTPIKATRAENVILGKAPTKGLIEEAAINASEQSKPASDLRGSEEYKREMVKVFTRRALTQALQRAGVTI